jgi:hypothetical protein
MFEWMSEFLKGLDDEAFEELIGRWQRNEMADMTIQMHTGHEPQIPVLPKFLMDECVRRQRRSHVL